jgi:hypothetical protein
LKSSGGSPIHHPNNVTRKSNAWIGGVLTGVEWRADLIQIQAEKLRGIRRHQARFVQSVRGEGRVGYIRPDGVVHRHFYHSKIETIAISSCTRRRVTIKLPERNIL